MWKSLQHNDQFGPFSAKYRNKGEEASLEILARDNSKLVNALANNAYDSNGTNGAHVLQPEGTTTATPQSYPGT